MNRLRKKITAIIWGLLIGTSLAWAGLETVTHIQDLNAAWPLGSDLASTSDDHMRNIKSALKTDFPNFNGTYTAATLPVFAIPSDTDTGMYSVAADDLGFSTGGTLRLDISTTAFTGTLPWRGQDGTAAAPALSFSGDTDTGIYRFGANTLGLATGGTVRATLDNSQWNFADGSAAVPVLAFSTDPDTGFYRFGANTLAIATGGSLRATIDNNQWNFADGTSSIPVLGFSNDPDTGFYRDTANQIGIALGGATAGQIAQGTFTGTLTGFTANPTGTVNYQRLGKIVMLWVTADITATSNAATMTMTGLPAIIQPASIVSGYSGNATDGGIALNALGATITTGTITFGRLQASGSSIVQGNFTNTGTKGLNAGWALSYPLP